MVIKAYNSNLRSKEISTEPVNPKKESENATLKNQTIRILNKVVKKENIKEDPSSIEKLETNAIPIKTQVIDRDKLHTVNQDKTNDSEDLAHNVKSPEEPDKNNESEVQDKVGRDRSNKIPAHLPQIPSNNNIPEKVQEVVRNKFQDTKDAIENQAAPDNNYVIEVPKAPVADTDKSSIIKNAEMSPMKVLEADVSLLKLLYLCKYCAPANLLVSVHLRAHIVYMLRSETVTAQIIHRS